MEIRGENIKRSGAGKTQTIIGVLLILIAIGAGISSYFIFKNVQNNISSSFAGYFSSEHFSSFDSQTKEILTRNIQGDMTNMGISSVSLFITIVGISWLTFLFGIFFIFEGRKAK